MTHAPGSWFSRLLQSTLIAAVVDALFMPQWLLLVTHHVAVSQTWTRWLPWVGWQGVLRGPWTSTETLWLAVPWVALLWWTVWRSTDTGGATSSSGRSAAGTRRASRGGGIYGTAHWRTAQDMDRTYIQLPDTPKDAAIRQAHAAERREPLTPPAGLVVGTMTQHPAPPKPGTHRPTFRVWVLHRDEHAFVLAPPRAGKTRRALMPTIAVLGRAGESLVINDPKGEICDMTATWLHDQGHVVIRADFRSPVHGFVWEPHEATPTTPFRWNPLAVAQTMWHAGDQTLAGQWVDDIVQGLLTAQGTSSESENNPYWRNVAQSALIGLVLAMLENTPNDACHIPTVQHLLGLPDETLNHWFETFPTTDLALRNARAYLKTAGESRQTANSFTLQYLQPFLSPPIQWMLSAHTFDPLRFTQTNHPPIALFLVVPDQRDALDPLVVLFIQQLIQTLSETASRLPGRRLPIRLTMVLDEFGSLPPIPAFAKTLSVSLSRGIRMILTLQNVAQLSRYDESSRQTILGNCGTWLCLGVNDNDTAQMLSQRMGQFDQAFTTKQHSASGANGPLQVSWGQQTVGRSLMTMDEIQRELTEGQALVLQQQAYPARTFMPDLSLWGLPWDSTTQAIRQDRTAAGGVRLWPDPDHGESLPQAEAPSPSSPSPSDPSVPPPPPSDPTAAATLADYETIEEFEDLPF